MTRSSTSFDIGAAAPALQSLCWWDGWALPPASSAAGASALGTPNQHNASIPRDFWLEDWEKQPIIDFHDRYPLEGYRRLAFMMLDADVVAVSPSSVYRVLKAAGLLRRATGKPSKKGKGFVQPLAAARALACRHLATSTSAARSTTCAASSTATAGSSSTGRSASR